MACSWTTDGSTFPAVFNTEKNAAGQTWAQQACDGVTRNRLDYLYLFTDTECLTWNMHPDEAAARGSACPPPKTCVRVNPYTQNTCKVAPPAKAAQANTQINNPPVPVTTTTVPPATAPPATAPPATSSGGGGGGTTGGTCVTDGKTLPHMFTTDAAARTQMCGFAANSFQYVYYSTDCRSWFSDGDNARALASCEKDGKKCCRLDPYQSATCGLPQPAATGVIPMPARCPNPSTDVTNDNGSSGGSGTSGTGTTGTGTTGTGTTGTGTTGTGPAGTGPAGTGTGSTGTAGTGGAGSGGTGGSNGVGSTGGNGGSTGGNGAGSTGVWGSSDAANSSGDSDWLVPVLVIVGVVLCCCCVAAVVGFWLKAKRSKNEKAKQNERQGWARRGHPSASGSRRRR